MKVIKKLEPYFIKFNKDWTRKDKEYLLDCTIGGAYQKLVIIITYDKITFLTNDSI